MNEIEQAIQIGMHYQKTNQLPQAEAIYSAILKKAPQHVDALQLLGSLAYQTGDYEKAVLLLEQAVNLAPNIPMLLTNLAKSYFSLNNWQAAKNAFEKSLTLDNNNHLNHLDLAVCLGKLQQWSKAKQHYLQALKLDPYDPQVYYNFAIDSHTYGETEAAIKLLNDAIKLVPDQANYHQQLGNYLAETNQVISAIEHLNQAIKLTPDNAELYSDLGCALRDSFLFDQAVENFNYALKLEPQLANAHHTLAQILLLKKDFANGWLEYEWRWHSDNLNQAGKTLYDRAYKKPLWEKQALYDKVLFVWGEQGIGDEINFLSMLPKLTRLTDKIIYEADSRLINLLKQSFPDLQFISREDSAAFEKLDYDFHCPIASLPLQLDYNPDQAPVIHPYLLPDINKIDDYKKELNNLFPNKKLVGIAWHTQDQQRQIPLAQWQPLFENQAIQFINLQYGDHKHELEAIADNKIFDINSSDPLTNLDDFAALIKALDLVISIDNSTVHMAGAVGTPCWTLLPVLPNWRWGLTDKQSHWYPNMTLFRQTQEGHWANIILALKNKLDQLI